MSNEQEEQQSPMRVLIMEDDLDLSHQWMQELRGAGFECDHATSRSEAQDRCMNRRYDALVLDVFIRGEDGKYLGDGGFNMITRLRLPHLAQTPDWGKDVPIVVVTGSTQANGFDALEYALHLGADRAMRKPFDPEELLRQVSSTLL